MNAALLARDTHPKKDFTSITQLGLKALQLGHTHATVLDPRLPAGLFAGLSEDLERLGEAVPGAKQAWAEAEAATAHQRATLEAGATRVRQVRAAVRRAKAPVDVKHAYGIGQYMNPRIVRDVSASIQQILDRAKRAPVEAKSIGIVKKDLTRLEATLAAIRDADTKQEQKRASAPLSTQERNRVANRILAAVARIEGAGRLEFAEDEGNRASFEALGAGPKGRRKRAAVDGAGAGEAGAEG